MPDSPFAAVGSQLVSKILGSILWVGIAVIVMGAVAFAMWFFFVYKKKFDIEVKITSSRSSDRDYIIFDKAAILNDRTTQTPYFRIWGLRRDFIVPKFNVLQRTNRGDLIEMYRRGEDEFYFLTLSKINKLQVINEDGKLIAMANQEQTLVDPGMAFWAQKRKGQNKKLFSVEKWYMKLLPYLPHLIGGVLMIFVLYILMDHLPGILSQLSELVREMSAMKRAEVITGSILCWIKK